MTQHLSSAIFMSPPRINGFVISPTTGFESPVGNRGRTAGERSGSLSSNEESPLHSPVTPLTPDSTLRRLLKRGRPKANSVAVSSPDTPPGQIACPVCKRGFPREKSLHAHMRTHTGKREPCPYSLLTSEPRPYWYRTAVQY